MNIRKANVTDAISICKISTNDLGYECDIELVRKRLESLDDSRERVFVAEIEEQVVGYVHVETYNLLYCETLVNILGLAVDTDYRRRCVGKALMEVAEDWGKEIGAVEVRLNSGAERKDAHVFYRKIGFDKEKNQIRFNKSIS